MFKLSFFTDNAVFQDDGANEIARILKAAAERLDDDHREGIIRDRNGNRIGSWSWLPTGESAEVDLAG